MSDTRAFLETETGKRIHFLFNPESLTMGFATAWAGTPVSGRSAPQQRFAGGSGGMLSAALLFDTTNSDAPVTDHTDQLVKLTQPCRDLPNHSDELANGRPEWVKFHWGKLHSFRAVVTDLSVEFTYFSPTGEPKRAGVTITLKQYAPEDDWPRQNPTSGTLRPARSHRVKPGETLDRIAAQHYGQPTRWRDIAAANGVRDPLEITPGTVLNIPMAGG